MIKTDHKQPQGFILPTVLVLSVVLLTLGLSVFQLTSSIARSLTDQYWQKLSKQTAQAGISYGSACIDQGLSPGTWPTTITQNNDCLGNTLSSPQPSVYTNTSDANPSPSPYKTTFTIYRPTTSSDGIAKARVVGTVDVLNTAGSTTIKSYTTEMQLLINGPTQAFTQISAGYKHVCGLTDGKVYCWGSNAVEPFDGNDTVKGQLGAGLNTKNSNLPVLVGGLLADKYVNYVSAGANFTCAVANGAVYCWGDNSKGQLGNGSTTDSNTPVAVTTTGNLSGKTATAVGAGLDFACALANGRVYCWGEGSNGQHGNGATNDTTTPDTATSTTNVSSISVGANHACAVAGPPAYCWGNGSNGQIGNGGTASTYSTPQQVAGSGPTGAYINKIYANNNYTCALVGGQPYCWGYNNNGQLGNGTTTSSSTAVPVLQASGPTIYIPGIITDFTSSSSSQYHTCALANGLAYCWGTNSPYGQLGNNASTNSSVPVAVNTSGLLSTNRTVTAITTGATSTCALAEGQPYCWGKGNAGTLGNGIDKSNCSCSDYFSLVPKKTVNSY